MPPPANHCITTLKLLALNRMIWTHYRDISSLKYKLIQAKTNLKQCVNNDQFTKLISIFEENNRLIKQSEKERLQDKYNWLVHKSSPSISEECHNAEHSVSVVESDSDRVTAIQVSLSDDELSILSLGPNFALTPVINDTLLDSVRVEMASCAYKLRWSQRRENVQSCTTKTQHIRQRGALINRPFAAPPPNDNPETEDDLKNLSRFTLQLIQSSKIKYNLSHDQAVGLKSLLLNKEKYHF